MTTTLARYLFLGNPISPSVNNNDDNILSYYSQNTDDPGCRTSPWSDWSPCSNKCGSGYQRRTRLYMIPFVPNRSCDVRLYDKQDCYMQEPSCDAYSSFSNSKSLFRSKGFMLDEMTRAKCFIICHILYESKLTDLLLLKLLYASQEGSCI